MESLYTISNELLSIFANIEENEGEVTEEELQALEIAQENLQEKLNSYRKAIRVWEADINACKEEEKRIKTARTVKENRISKLKDRMLFAVQKFGCDGKPNKKGKSNKFYELSDCRLYTRTTESVEIDEHRTNILVNLFIEYCKRDESIDMSITSNDKFYDDLLTYINEDLHIYFPGEPDFTMTDLQTAILEYTVKTNIADIYYGLRNHIKEASEEYSIENLNYASDKSSLKLVLQTGHNLTLAKLKETDSLTIK